MYVDAPGLRVWLLLDGEAPDAGRTGGEAAAGEPDAGRTGGEAAAGEPDAGRTGGEAAAGEPDAGRTGGEAAAGEPDAADAEATPGEMNVGHLMTGTTRALRSG